MATVTPPTVRLYKFTKAEHARRSLTHHRLKVSRIAEVNDPFEFFALNVMNRTARRLLKEFKEEHDRTHGLLCFSDEWHSPVLWGHYADCHKGVGLGFDVDVSLGERGAEKVVYLPAKLDLEDEDPDPYALSDDVQRQLSITKADAWSYEREWRVIVKLADCIPEGERFHFPFSARLRLRDVILGPYCPHEDLPEFRSLARDCEPTALVSRARLGFKYFEVKEDGRYKPS